MNKLMCHSLIAFSFFGMHSSHAEISFEQELKQGCSKLSQYKQLGQKFYNQKNYKKALEQFKDQAAWTPFCQTNGEEFGINISDKEVAIANNNVGLTYAKWAKPLWARVWFQIDENFQMSQFNLKQLPTPKQNSDLSGQYVSFSGFGQWNYITVNKSPNKKNYDISFSSLYMGSRGLIYGPNTGEFDAQMSLNKKTGKTDECGISLKFGFNSKVGNFISVMQSESSEGCGYFGMNVSADGIYQKVELNQ